MWKYCFLILACYAAFASDSAGPDASIPVELTLTPKIARKTLTITGTLNVKDGAIVNYEVNHELHQRQPLNRLYQIGELTVEDGRYHGTVDVSKWPAGKIAVWVAFQTYAASQPAWVKEMFGDTGGKMDGPAVKKTGRIRWAETSAVVSKK